MLGKLLDLRKEIKVEDIVISKDEDTIIVEIHVANPEQADKLEKTLKEFINTYRWLL